MAGMSSAELIEHLRATGSIEALAAWDTLMNRSKEALDALLNGLCHANGTVRAACALLRDHLGDDRCVEPLRRTLKTDPLESVRRCALHSLVCQECKECPLNANIIAPIMEAALTDRSLAVRRRAVQYLVGQKCDARVADAARRMLEKEADSALLSRARRALAWHEGAKTGE